MVYEIDIDRNSFPSSLVETEDVGTFLGLVAGVVGAALTWLAGLGVISILISIGFGSLLTYVVQSRTQRRAWKREATLRKVDSIYGPLYQEILTTSMELFKHGPFVRKVPNSSVWESIRTTYHYFLVPVDLRKKLDDFYSMLSNFFQKQNRSWSIADEKIIQNLKSVFGQEVEGVNCTLILTLKTGRTSSTGAELYDSLLNGQHPVEYFRKRYPDYFSYGLTVQLQRSGRSEPLFTPESSNEEVKRKFGDVISKTIQDINADPTINYLRETAPKILFEANVLKNRLRAIIEEPWKV